MKLSTWMPPVLLLLISGLLVPLVQNNISGWVSPDRLEANLSVGKWAPIAPSNTEFARQLRKIGLGEFESGSLSDRDHLSYASFTVQNPGQRVVTNVRIKFYSKPEIVSYRDSEKKRVFVQDPDEIFLPDFNPGDKFELNIWDSYYSFFPIDASRWETFSSEGKIRITQTTQDPEYFGFGTGSLLDTAMGIMMPFSIVSLILLFIGTTIYYLLYCSSLLQSEDHYIEEKTRFDREGNKFSPKFPDKSS